MKLEREYRRTQVSKKRLTTILFILEDRSVVDSIHKASVIVKCRKRVVLREL
jgi:hypothetical protein